MRTTLRKRLLRLTCISVVVASLIVTIAAEIGIFSLSNSITKQNGLTVTSIAEKTLNMFEEDNTIISKMIMITDDLPNMNLQKILDTLGIEEIFEKDNSTNKDLIKTKKIEQ